MADDVSALQGEGNVSAPKEIAELWPAVEAAAPNEPYAMLIAADRCAELHAANPNRGWDHLEFALRWCAGRNVRPYRTKHIREPWLWLRDQSSYRHLSWKEVDRRDHAILPRCVYDELNSELCEIRYKSSYLAYEALAAWLDGVRSALHAPTVTILPPDVVKTAAVVCASCGVMRARDRLECPVCKAGEL